MRIAIDMQGAQTDSRLRGIGRYTLALAQAIARNRGEHEVILALSGLFPDTIEHIRAAFDGLLPQENIRLWYAPGPVNECEPANEWRHDAAGLIREAFLSSLKPDVIHISSLFEGYGDDAVTSIGRFDTNTLVSVLLHDLIPLVNPVQYLDPHPAYAHHYRTKIRYLSQSTLMLANSEATRQEGIEQLGVADDRVVNISAASDAHFLPVLVNHEQVKNIRKKFGLTRPFVLYAGGADERKNLPRLIQAFASLPAPLRAGHQLLLVGKMHEVDIAIFKHHAKKSGLKRDEMRFTGYVTDDQLVQLYNLCQLFVFPSWHEGFGLPALEAMACGAPVIGANTSSLPEVIGLDSALFDPFDVAAIATKMAQALGDDAFRATLREHGLQQAKKFSWDESAKRALAAWEAGHANHAESNSYTDRSLSRGALIQTLAHHIPNAEPLSLLALAACLAQNQSAGMERQLMLDVSELARSDAATGIQRVARSYLKALLQSPPAGFRVEPVCATRDEGYRYARRFTQKFLGFDTRNLTDDPVQWQRGDIFFGLDMQPQVQLAHKVFYRQLRLDGVTVKFLVHDLLPIQRAAWFKDNTKEPHEQWLAMIAATDGAICVSKTTADAFEDWLAENAIRRSSNFQITCVHNGGDIDGSKPSQGLPEDAAKVLSSVRSRPSFLCVATLEPRKGQQQIVDAFQMLWNEGLDVNLILVGKQGWEVESLLEALHNHLEKDHRLFWLQGISDEFLEQVYATSTCLIAASLNEGFGLPLIEAARHGVPIVARDIPVFREVAADCAFYFNGETPHELATALKAWCALHQDGRHPKPDQLHWSTWKESSEKLKAALVQENYPRRQLLVDVSEWVQRDAKSGIQRVVRSILREWLSHPPAGYRVEPVYATVEQGYRYARRFTQSFLGYPDQTLQDETMEYAPGDAFFGLDFQPQVVAAQRAFYQTLRRQGVRVQFAVYDLLCISMPQHFPHATVDEFSQWLEVVAESDGALCISKAVADELADWVKQNGPARQRPFKIDCFHLGTNVDNSVPTKGLPDNAVTVLDHLHSRNSFLMVGTLELRKGQAQCLKAFERLWQSGVDANLVIVGQQGWLVENLGKRLRAHPELNKRLFWLESISDEYLEKIYAASTCLLAASEGEGFDLPLIEAAQHKLLIIARDIPVFREIGGQHAHYFEGLEPGALAAAINDWITSHKQGRTSSTNAMPCVTWAQSTQQLLKAIFTQEHCADPAGNHRFD
jgi:glycosyltransferase involved in cell wall biosynthesis